MLCNFCHQACILYSVVQRQRELRLFWFECSIEVSGSERLANCKFISIIMLQLKDANIMRNGAFAITGMLYRIHGLQP